MSVRGRVSLSASTVRASLIGISGAVAARVFIDLRLGRVQKYQQTWVIRITRLVHESIQQVRGRDRCAAGEIGSVANVKGHRVGAILKSIVIENQIHARNCCVTQCEVTVCIRAEAVQIEHPVRLVSTAVVKDHNQSIQRSVSNPAIEKLYEFSGVCARLIGIDLVDDHVGRRRRTWRRTR